MNYPRILLSTSFGDITLELFPEEAPKTVENFVGLVQQGYYDGILFHRVIRDFMIQGGDPTGTGMGGESIWGAPFADELPNKRTHKKGMISMANAGPNTNGSQFFIVTTDKTYVQDLDSRHVIFGEVIDGFDVVEQIEALPVDSRDRPRINATIEKAKVLP